MQTFEVYFKSSEQATFIFSFNVLETSIKGIAVAFEVCHELSFNHFFQFTIEPFDIIRCVKCAFNISRSIKLGNKWFLITRLLRISVGTNFIYAKVKILKTLSNFKRLTR